MAFTTLTGLIVMFSLSPADQSLEQSGIFVDMFVWIFRLFNYVPTNEVLGVLTTLVRKLIGHFGLFLADGVFGYLTFSSFIIKKKRWLPLLISLAVMLVLSISAEMLQLLASGRAMMLFDVIFNYAGAFTGITLVYLLINKKLMKETHI